MTDIDNILAEISPYYKSRKKKKDKGVDVTIPSSQHKLIYNSSSEALEQIYFWILDFMGNMFGGNVEKLTDNFASSPGSGHFGEMGQRISILQQNASNIMGTVATMLKGIINLIYDLREFKIRLSHYDAAKSPEKYKKEAGLLALKQIWMDKVDIQRGQGSINAMSSGQLQFVTLRDSFMAVNSVEEVDRLDLNDRVRRVLKPRVQEFFEWKMRSEQELRKRFETEKLYLKSQVNNLKLNARWAKPYLKAAQQLTMNEKMTRSPELVNLFNTTILELVIMGSGSVNVNQAVIDKDLPPNFKKMKNLRKYYSAVMIDFNFRGIPSKTGQHFVFPGRATVLFKSYALNEDELKLLREKLSETDLEDSLKLVQGMTDDSLQQFKLDIEEFMDDDEKEAKKEETQDSNPFSALFSFMKPKQKEKNKKGDKIDVLKKKGIKKDSYAEQYVRNIAEANAINSCYTVFDIYKKSHNMASLPYVEEAEAKAPRTKAEEIFGFK